MATYRVYKAPASPSGTGFRPSLFKRSATENTGLLVHTLRRRGVRPGHYPLPQMRGKENVLCKQQ